MAEDLKPTRKVSNNVYYENLHDAILPHDGKYAGNCIFIYNCTNIELPDSITEVWSIRNSTIKKWPKNVTKVKYISGCADIEIPDSVTEISTIKDSTIKKWPKHIAKIEKVESCNNVEFPNTITHIGEIYDSTVKKWSNAIGSIGRISRCINLVVPSSVSTIERITTGGDATRKFNCFIKILSSSTIITQVNGEYGSLHITIDNPNPPILGKVYNLASDDTLIVPVDAKETYANHPKWGKFKNICEDKTLKGGRGKLNTSEKDKLKIESQEKRIHQLEKLVAELQKTQNEVFGLDRLIDAALEDYIVTEEERRVLLEKASSIGMSEDEFTIYLNARIEKRLKERSSNNPNDNKGFLESLFS